MWLHLQLNIWLGYSDPTVGPFIFFLCQTVWILLSLSDVHTTHSGQDVTVG